MSMSRSAGACPPHAFTVQRELSISRSAGACPPQAFTVQYDIAKDSSPILRSKTVIVSDSYQRNNASPENISLGS